MINDNHHHGALSGLPNSERWQPGLQLAAPAIAQTLQPDLPQVERAIFSFPTSQYVRTKDMAHRHKLGSRRGLAESDGAGTVVEVMVLRPAVWCDKPSCLISRAGACRAPRPGDGTGRGGHNLPREYRSVAGGSSCCGSGPGRDHGRWPGQGCFIRNRQTSSRHMQARIRTTGGLMAPLALRLFDQSDNERGRRRPLAKIQFTFAKPSEKFVDQLPYLFTITMHRLPP
jgi:hypothetical protein